MRTAKVLDFQTGQLESGARDCFCEMEAGSHAIDRAALQTPSSPTDKNG